MDAAALLLNLHGEVLRAICAHQGRHYEGVGAAARSLARQGKIPGKLKAKLISLDQTAAWVRHVNAPRCTEFLEEVQSALASPALFDTGSPGGSDDGSVSSSQVEESTVGSVISNSPAISATCKQGEVLMCPQLLMLPTPPEAAPEISYSAAISAKNEKCVRELVDGSVISYSAAITEKGVSTAPFATPVKTFVGGDGGNGGESAFLTPTTGCTASSFQPGDDEEEEEEVIATFLGSKHDLKALPEFPDLRDSAAATSSNAAISAVEKGVVKPESVISPNAAISGEKRVVVSPSGISSNAAISAAEKGVVVSQSVISSNAAISGEKGLCASIGAEISYNVAITGCEKGPQSAALISSNSAISAFAECAADVGSSGLTEHFNLAKDDDDDAAAAASVKGSDISLHSSAAISACEKGLELEMSDCACGSQQFDVCRDKFCPYPGINSSAAISAYEKGPDITLIHYSPAISAESELVMSGAIERFDIAKDDDDDASSLLGNRSDVKTLAVTAGCSLAAASQALLACKGDITSAMISLL